MPTVTLKPGTLPDELAAAWVEALTTARGQSSREAAMSSPIPQRRKAHGFTLIELLVVVAVVAILAGLLFPVFAQSRESARRAVCASNMRQVVLGTLLYTQDHDELLP